MSTLNSLPDDSPQRQLTQICNNPSHPFSDFVRNHLGEIRATLWKHSCGVVVSGGQTGVDTAAFEVADSLAIPRTGFAPRSFINEIGSIRQSFQQTMREVDATFGTLPTVQIEEESRCHPAARYGMYAERTCLNAKFSNATIILSPGPLAGGDLLTYQAALEHVSADRIFIVDLLHEVQQQATRAREWLRSKPALFLNIAGSRESARTVHGISPYETGLDICRELLRT